MRRSALTWLGTPQLLIAAYILAVFMHVWLSPASGLRPTSPMTKCSIA